MKQLYASTGNISKILDVSVDFLNSNKGKIFKIGEHYYIPKGKKYALWNIMAMVIWVESGTTENSEADTILNSICA